MRLVARLVLVLVLLPLSPTLLSAKSPSNLPKGLDSTVQVFQATAKISTAKNPDEKPLDLTSIASAKDAEALMTPLVLKLMSDASLCTKGVAILLHTAEWRVIPPKTKTGDIGFSLTASQWAGFQGKYTGNACKLTQKFRVDKNPLFYADTSIYLIGINYFADADGNGVDPNQLQIGYKVSTTPSTPQNIQDLGTLVAALVGFTVPSVGTESANFVGPKATGDKSKLPHFFVLEQSVSPTSPPPFSINISPVLQPATSTLPAAIVGQGYSTDLSGRAGRGNTISDIAGLPLGMVFDPETKVISGTPAPAAAGNQPLQVTVSDKSGSQRTFLMTLPVQPAKSPSSPSPPGTPTSKGAQGNQTSTTSPSQPIDCSNVSAKNPCTFSRNFPVDDREYWDVSLGLAIPGPKENVFKPSSGGGVPSSSPTTHTDAYAFVDFYPFAYLWTKQSYAPHINGGIPITSQSLHRPYFGLSEDISGWAQRHGFPLDVCVFGGLVFMKQQLYDPTAPTLLRTDWARKAMYGVEVPISGIVSKLAGKGSKSSNAKGSSGQ